MRKALLILLIIILGAAILLHVTDNNHLYKAIKSTYLSGETGPTIDDYNKFEYRVVKAGGAEKWHLSNEYNKYVPSKKQLDYIKKMETVAFLIIHKDSILYENYWKGYSDSSLTNSFSMAKTFVSIAIGVALHENKIKSLSQKVSDYIPEFSEGEKANVTIKDLLSMSSGIDFGESYDNPLGFMAKTYYGKDLYQLSTKKKMTSNPGELWKYQGGNTLLLSFILEKATGKTLSEYFSEKIWKPIGAENNALWSLNEKEGTEKAFCCFYSNARDFARVGKLYLQNGRWNGDTLVPYWYIRESILPVNIQDVENKKVDYYGYHWWLGQHKNKDFFYARGIQGQYIFVIPKERMIIVRLGKKREKTSNGNIPDDASFYINMATDLLAQKSSAKHIDGSF